VALTGNEGIDGRIILRTGFAKTGCKVARTGLNYVVMARSDVGHS
jgi:hypothetical protein